MSVTAPIVRLRSTDASLRRVHLATQRHGDCFDTLCRLRVSGWQVLDDPVKREDFCRACLDWAARMNVTVVGQ